MHSHSTFFVPSATIKDILTQVEPNGRRAKWIATLLEYDREIRPTKLVKGQGLAKLMAQSNHEALSLAQTSLPSKRKGKFIHISLLPLGTRT